MRLLSDPIKKGDDIVACGRPLLSSPDQLAIVTQCLKDVDALPVRQGFDSASGRSESSHIAPADLD